LPDGPAVARVAAIGHFSETPACSITCGSFLPPCLKSPSALWIVPALFSLTLFALLLTRVEATYAGRAYAAYGGIYIVASIGWLAVVERIRPLSSDWIGVALCVIGATVILFGPRLSAS
jgi:small multidrug resistance family-3 protein